MGHFEFDINTAERIVNLAASCGGSIDEFLTRPGLAMADFIAHMASNHPDMNDEAFLSAVRPMAYQQLIGELT